MSLSLESKNIIEHCDLPELDLIIWEIKEAINKRDDVENVIALLEDNGIILAVDNETGERKICKKKRPDEIPN